METTLTSSQQKEVGQMKSGWQQFLVNILKVSGIIFPILIISLFYWVASSKMKADWLITSNFDPTEAGFLTGQQSDSWAVTLASPQFSSQDFDTQQQLARSKSAELWNDLGAKVRGYSKRELDNWFLGTVENYTKYPIKKINLTYGEDMTYRDLSSTAIPKPNIHRAAYQSIIETNIFEVLKLLPWIILPIFGLLFFFGGIIAIFKSKRVPTFARIVVVSLLLAMVLEAWIFKANLDRKIIGHPLQVFNVGNSYVYAKGTWKGVNQNLAYPNNSVEIQCSKQTGICTEATALLSDTSLMVNTTDWGIIAWNDKEVVVEEEGSCTTTKMIINFRDKDVTQIKTPKDPLPSDCIHGAGGKFITELADGIDVAFPEKQRGQSPWGTG